MISRQLFLHESKFKSQSDNRENSLIYTFLSNSCKKFGKTQTLSEKKLDVRLCLFGLTGRW